MSNRNNQGEWRMGKRRANRKTLFAQNGFLSFEQEAFSKLPLNIPYAKTMRRDRLKLFARAKKEKWPLNKYRQAVAWEYESRNISPSKDFKGRAFALLRWFQDEWARNADPNDPYLLKMARKHHGGKELINREQKLEQHRKYNANPETKAKRAKYRREHRDEIKRAEKLRKDFKRRQMLNG